jgi:hypothetical protein
MELRVQLKVCEGCGCLWYRTQGHASVYCIGCEEKLRQFPPPQTRRGLGRRARKKTVNIWAVAAAAGGAA